MPKPYRQNAAVIVTDEHGRVLLCRRVPAAGPHVQTVQGGVKEGETHREAAARELYEELGIRPSEFTIVGELAEKFRYEFSPDHEYTKSNRYRGQEQTFFLAKVDPNAQFNLAAHGEQEFQEVWWGSPEEFVREAWELKRPGIEMALRGFGLLKDA
jgi:8-oxo-dGTP pyrophosphatase MutT (NUDIX family)